VTADIIQQRIGTHIGTGPKKMWGNSPTSTCDPAGAPLTAGKV
jgi:hypothetical protein